MSLLFSPRDPLAKRARCLRCGASLRRAPDPRCPRCRTFFDASNPDTYLLRPTLGDWKLWVPGMLLTLVAGLAYLDIALRIGNFGWGLVAVVPLVLGILLGYWVRVRPVLLLLAAATLLLALVGLAFTFDWSGLLCSLILAAILFLPVLVGLILGVALSRLMKSHAQWKRNLILIALLALPAAFIYLESLVPQSFAELAIRTERVIETSPETLWSSLLFYEEVRQPAPLIARIGIPRPLYTRGIVRAEGDVKTCVYDKGHLVKRIARYEPLRILTFQVIEQVGVEERSVQLRGGSFRFSPAGPGRTRVVLTTQYLPKLQARAMWQPWERAVVSALHDHVLDEMTRRAAQKREVLP